MIRSTIKPAMKPKTCKECGNTFKPKKALQSVCDLQCAISQSRSKRVAQEAKVARKTTREARERIKTKSQWRAEAQTAVNAYCRARDAGKPCISCDKPDDGTHQRHASHFRSVAACSQLRYNTWNIHSSCMQCNAHKSGNILEYRIRLIKKLGYKRVHWLEGQNWLTKYNIDYLKRIKKVFNKRTRHIKRIRLADTNNVGR
jgi:hypothetical protein